MSKKNGKSLESLPNIGKTTAGKLREIGIETAEDFLDSDPYDVFEELRERVDPTLCRCALAALVGAKMGVRWHEITRDAAKEYERRHPEHEWDSKC